MFCIYIFTGFLSLICNSLNCSSLAIPGAFVIKSFACEFFGNAITSLIELDLVKSATSLSKPRAKPPCGGVPYWKALTRNSNFS